MTVHPLTSKCVICSRSRSRKGRQRRTAPRMPMAAQLRTWAPLQGRQMARSRRPPSASASSWAAAAFPHCQVVVLTAR